MGAQTGVSRCLRRRGRIWGLLPFLGGRRMTRAAARKSSTMVREDATRIRRMMQDEPYESRPFKLHSVHSSEGSRNIHHLPVTSLSRDPNGLGIDYKYATLDRDVDLPNNIHFTFDQDILSCFPPFLEATDRPSHIVLSFPARISHHLLQPHFHLTHHQ
jgi:hypothetical protein